MLSLYWNSDGNYSWRRSSEPPKYTYLKIERRAALPDRRSNRVGLSGGAFSIEARSRRSKTPEEAELSASIVKECQWVASSRARIASNVSPIDGSKRTSRGLSSCKIETISGRFRLHRKCIVVTYSTFTIQIHVVGRRNTCLNGKYLPSFTSSDLHIFVLLGYRTVVQPAHSSFYNHISLCEAIPVTGREGP
jgi:hypothetical protein